MNISKNIAFWRNWKEKTRSLPTPEEELWEPVKPFSFPLKKSRETQAAEEFPQLVTIDLRT